MSVEIKFPVTEIFHSPQGEGVHSGVAMTFVRLAGCNVGKPMTSQELLHEGIRESWVERCHDWGGNSFNCDTNFRMTCKMTVDEILSEVTRARICLTGGEPLMHDVRPLLEAAWNKGIAVHVETSGTKAVQPLRDIAPYRSRSFLWICISPKQGYLESNFDEADEIKVLIGERFSEEDFLIRFKPYMEQGKVSISPVNDICEFDKVNARKCLELQEKYPKLRISIQSHKLLGAR